MFQFNGGRALRGTRVVGVRSPTPKQVGRDELINGMYLGRFAVVVVLVVVRFDAAAECALLLVCLSEARTGSGQGSGDGRYRPRVVLRYTALLLLLPTQQHSFKIES